MFINSKKTNSPLKKKHLFITMSLATFAFLSLLASAQTNTDKDDEAMLDSFIQSRGYESTIIFSAANIKQFWPERNVVSQDNIIKILLDSKLQSSLLKIKLANVNVSNECKVDIFSKSSDFKFNILADKTQVLSKSSSEDDFIGYHIESASFRLKKTNALSFSLQFVSSASSELKINKIVLSFPRNTSSSSTEAFNMKKDNYETQDAQVTSDESKNCLITGKRSRFYGEKITLQSQTPLHTYISVKNTGKTATKLYVGYSVYDEEGIAIDAKNYPYQDINKILKVISSSKDNNIIVVDGSSEWNKNCYLALNANEDMSDIPNKTLAGRIVDFKKNENNLFEITLDKPLSSEIRSGTKVRVHGTSGAYLYTYICTLLPEEEITFYSTIAKDDSFLRYSSEAFSRGAYCVVPLLLSYSVVPQEDNTITIKDYSVSY